MAGVFENERKKWFPLARKSVLTSRNNFLFQKLGFTVSTSRKNSLNKRIPFKTEKITSIDRNIRKIKENGCQ